MDAAEISLAEATEPPVRRVDWPHAPPHSLGLQGTYFVTGATWKKQHIFREAGALKLLHDSLLMHTRDEGWQLEAWAVFSNHYHFVARPTRDGLARKDLGILLARLHKATASEVNALQGQTGRKVWHNFRETLLTLEKSWLARLNYTHRNAVKHRLVDDAGDYPWCSAAWFQRTATGSWRQTVESFKTDRLEIEDDF
jgi:putative transposase